MYTLVFFISVAYSFFSMKLLSKILCRSPFCISSKRVSTVLYMFTSIMSSTTGFPYLFTQDNYYEQSMFTSIMFNTTGGSESISVPICDAPFLFLFAIDWIMKKTTNKIEEMGCSGHLGASWRTWTLRWE